MNISHEISLNMTCLTTFAKFVFSHKTCSPYFLSMLWKVIKKRFIICNSRTILFKNQTNMFLFITESRWFTYTRWFAEFPILYIYTYIYYWVVMAVIGQGTSLSVRQSFKVKPVHYAHRTRTANPVILQRKASGVFVAICSEQ